MEAVAAKLDVDAVVQEVGVVADDCDARDLAVLTSHGRYRASVAFSCLVEPSPGDCVLLATTLGGEAFVLAVLERSSEAPAVMRVDRDIQLRADGRFRVAATEGVDLTTPKEMNLVSGELSVRAKQGRFAIDALTHLGRMAHVDVEQVKGFFQIVDHVAERIPQTVKRSYRFVEELDVTRANQVDVRAEGNVNVRGRNTVVSAEQLVKMDAEQIHLG